MLENKGEDATDNAVSDASVRVEEVRPSSVVLRITLRNAAEFSALDILRDDGDSELKLLQSVELSPKIAASIEGDGIVFVDRDPVANSQYVVAAVRADQTSELSEVLPISLQKTPEPPNAPTATVMPGAVELTWKSSETVGAVVFRRDLVSGQKRPERIGVVSTSAGGVFVDPNVMPGGAYAYRIALARDYGDFLQFGPPSDELYVTVPDVSVKP